MAPALALGLVLTGCGCESGVQPGGGASTTPTGTGAGGTGSTSTTSSTTSAPCPPQQLPQYVPDGWQEYTDWSCNCRGYVPGSTDVMPAPIEWQPCPEAPGGMDCRVMVTDWAYGAGSAIGARPMLDVSAKGTVLGFVRAVNAERYTMKLAADVDGPVRSAMIVPLRDGCYFANRSLAEGTRVLVARGENGIDPEVSKHLGVIGGPLEDLHPPVIVRHDDVDNEGWVGGASWLVRESSTFVLTAHPWDMSTEHFLTSPATDPEGQHANQLVVRGDAVFWRTHTAVRAGIMMWTELGGTQEFRRWVGDATRGAAGFGTDGIDMVWLEGEGKEPGSSHYPSLSVMTAPFTTDPAALAPRRLRSHNYDAITDAFQVGCGYAVGQGGGIVSVVRLSDGWAWYLPESDEQEFGVPVGVTCDEVFAAGTIAGTMNVARIRLDSLGPGVPPD